MAADLLRLEEVTAGYAGAVAIDAVSLRVGEGEAVALLGHNGAGKTTTLRAIMGIVRPIGGRIQLLDERIDGLPPHALARRGVGFVPDDRRVFAELSVADNLGLARRLSRRSGPWDLEGVFELFPVLEERAGHGAGSLSGGEQKMLAIGRALVQNPRLLLLDEAAEGLAPLVVEQLVGVARRIADSGVALLVADQNLSFAGRVSQRAYVLDRGRVVHEGRSRDIAADEEVLRRHLAV